MAGQFETILKKKLEEQAWRDIVGSERAVTPAEARRIHDHIQWNIDEGIDLMLELLCAKRQAAEKQRQEKPLDADTKAKIVAFLYEKAKQYSFVPGDTIRVLAGEIEKMK